MVEALALGGPARPSSVGWIGPAVPGPWPDWLRGHRVRHRGDAPGQTPSRRHRAARPPARARRGGCRSLGRGLALAGWRSRFGWSGIRLGRWFGLRFRALGLGVGGGFGVGCRRGLTLWFAWPFAVFSVVGDVKTTALEYQTRTTRDLPHCGPAADRAPGARLVCHLLEFLEDVPVGAAVFICGHDRSKC